MRPRRKPPKAVRAMRPRAIQSTVVSDTEPVSRTGRSTSPVAPGYNARALGGVVQLVRTPACHAGGRGFESRRSRSWNTSKQAKEAARAASFRLGRRPVDGRTIHDPAVP